MAAKDRIHLPKGTQPIGPRPLGQDPSDPKRRTDNKSWPISSYDARLNPTPEQADTLRRYVEMVSNLGGDWTILLLAALADRVRAASCQDPGLTPEQEILRKRLVFLSWFVPLIPPPGRGEEAALGKSDVDAAFRRHLQTDRVPASDVPAWRLAVAPLLQAPLRDGAAWRDFRSIATILEDGKEILGLPGLGSAPGQIFSPLLSSLFGDDLERRFLLSEEDDDGNPNTTENARNYISQMLGTGKKGDFDGASAFAADVLRHLREGDDISVFLQKIGVADPAAAAKKASPGKGRPNALVERFKKMPAAGVLEAETVKRLKAAAEGVVSRGQNRVGSNAVAQARASIDRILKARTGLGFVVPSEARNGKKGTRGQDVNAINDHGSILALALSQVMRHHSWTIRNERARQAAEKEVCRLQREIQATAPTALADWERMLQARQQDPSHALDVFRTRATAMLPRVLNEWRMFNESTSEARMAGFKKRGHGRERADRRLVEFLARGDLPWALGPDGPTTLRWVLEEAKQQDIARRLKPPAFRVPCWTASPLYPMFGDSRPGVKADGTTVSLTLLDPHRGLVTLDIPWQSKRLAQEIGPDLGRGTRLSRRATAGQQASHRPIFENARLVIRRAVLDTPGAEIHWHLHTTVRIPPEGPWTRWCRLNGIPRGDRLPQGAFAERRGAALREYLGGLADLRVLGVDLGQRAAAGAAVWHVLPKAATAPTGRTIRHTGYDDSPTAALERLFLIHLPGDRDCDLRPIYKIEQDFLRDCARVLQSAISKHPRKAAEGHEVALEMLQRRLNALGTVGGAIRFLRDRRLSFKPEQADIILDKARMTKRRKDALKVLREQDALDKSSVHDALCGLEVDSSEQAFERAHAVLAGVWKLAHAETERQARRIEHWVLFGRLSGQGHKRLYLGVGGLSMDRIQRIERLRGLRMCRRDIDDPALWNVVRPHAEQKADFMPGLARRANALREERARTIASRIVEAALGIGAHPKAGLGPETPRPASSDLPMCQAIAIERLADYRPDDARPQKENKRLRDWMVGRVRTHLIQAAAIHGIALIEVDPDMTSQTDHRTGRIGLRGAEVPVARLIDTPLEEVGAEEKAVIRDVLRRHWNPIDRIWTAPSGRRWTRREDGSWDAQDGRKDPPPPVFVWRKGGPLFVSEDHPVPFHADLNAAANIAWKTISNPLDASRHPILPADPQGAAIDDRNGAKGADGPYKGAPFLGRQIAVPQTGTTTAGSRKADRTRLFAAADDPDWQTPSRFKAATKRAAREERQKEAWRRRLGDGLADDLIPWI